MAMFAGLDVGFKRTAACVIDEAGAVVWRGVVDTHPEMISGALRRWRKELAESGTGERIAVALACARAFEAWLAGGVHGCAPSGGRGEGAAGEDGQGGRAGAGGDAADGLLRRGACEERGEPSAEGTTGGARSVGAHEAGARQSGPRVVAAVRDQAAVAPGHEEVRCGGACGGPARPSSIGERDGVAGAAGGGRKSDCAA